MPVETPPRADRTAPILPPEIAAEIVDGRLRDPFSWMGLHQTEHGLRIVAFDPGAEMVELRTLDHAPVAKLKKVHSGGVFAALLEDRAERFPYHLSFSGGGQEWVVRDAYSFGPVLGEIDEYLLAEGTHEEIWTRLGAHPIEHEGVEGTNFVVWAPNARRVSVIGDFNFWDGRRHPMRLRYGAGLWEIFLPGIGPGALYKFEVVDAAGVPHFKADPVGFHYELAPGTASIVHALPAPAKRGIRPPAISAREGPVSIYEVHPGSWKRGEGNRMLDYDELAEDLVAYVADMGFTHIEFMPISEHPFSGSWGYQPIGLFAPTARFGDPDGFRRLVQACHRAELGVIIDWVPAHFPSDPHGLARFDGTALYEHEDPRLGFHQDWDTLIYNFGRTEVANFLRSNALFWFEQYGVDALRVDAVASMLYLDYSRNEGEWIPNRYGGRENLEAIEFLKSTNQLIAARDPGRLMIAEESTAFPGVSRTVDEGGLGFDFKWNMGWMHDTLDYMQKDPAWRKYHHNQMTFGMIYAYTENFILPLSHDEVVHGKGSLLGKMPGDRWQKFANLRAYYGFMWAHPGKKLLFMGCEFGQEREWDHDHSLDWHLLEQPDHAGLQRLVRDLNRLYSAQTALHQLDCEPEGFSWIEGGDVEQSVFSFERRDRDGNVVVAISNMTPGVRHDYNLGLPKGGNWVELLNTDAGDYGGSGVGNGGRIAATETPMHGRPYSASLVLPPLATLILAPEPEPGPEPG